ncbi:uncharacterized protein LOC123445096 isoform X3 [Hordeum vulgare subsp. vulgare]|uniref:uncharacterized protein LOC123445096 isoform X3 n=1 Tax=Hordeum vulgare subsp. vulgare TaxID=112509 RepID=UPI001D1A5814|nr:uncharacterized protein LOC123445096 isoform X3 [Hordeum vulgare subsp. vulgare]
MGKRRKHDQIRDDESSSSDSKRYRSCHCHNRRMLSEGMSREGFSDTFCDAVIELKDVIRVKVATEEKFERKIKKLKQKREKDKNEHKEDIRILKEDFTILKEYFRILKESHEELRSKIQEMPKEGCAEVNHYDKSPSQRSQLSQSTRFRLVIENNVSRTIYKKESVETEDGGGHIKVVMYDGGNRIAPDHSLASARVDLVLIEGSFNEPKRGSWSKEEFEESIIKPRKGITRLVKNGTFDLTDGSCDHEGAIIMDNSQQREVKLGVMIAVHTEVRVLEGVSNPFKVQEGKTKKTASSKKRKKPSPVPTRNLVQTTSTHTAQHGQSPITPDEQHNLPPPVIQDVLQKSDRGKHTEFLTDDTAEDNRLNYPLAIVPQIVEGNGLNGNGQQLSQHIPMQILWQPASAHSMRNGQNYSLPQTGIQNPSQAAGYCPAYQPLLACEDQYTSFSNASSQLAFPNLSEYMTLNDIRQWTSIPEGEISVEHVHPLIVPSQIQETYGSFRCGQVLLQWDKPHVEPKEHWNFLDELMPLHSTQSRFYGESFPTTSLMDKAHKLLASNSSGDSVLKMITIITSRATQAPQRRGILIRPIEPYDSDADIFRPPVKKQRNAKYQLRFVNSVCNDYYTQEQIKSENGNLLKVALYDENNLVVTSGPLSSASVEVVLLHGDFNADGQDYWTSEEFSSCLVHPQSVEEPPALVGDCALALTDGETDLGNISFQISSFHARTGKFKMGVEIKNVREASAQEGITSPFLVRVRQGEESSRHRITSPEALLRVRMELPKQVCGPLQCDARENVCASPFGMVPSALQDQSSPERNDLVASRAEDDDSMVQSGSGVLLFPAPRPPSEQVQVPQPEPGLNCPRCNSTNTKFFNNNSLTQPHHFCRECGLGLGATATLGMTAVPAADCDIAGRAAGAPAPAAYVAAAAAMSTSTKPSTTACGTSALMSMSMVERARLAKVPQPEPGLKCPRCDSTNTKFCYFNNYSLTQPRHFCHTCGRSWTRGGALRSVRVGSRYSCHAKRSTKSKASAREPAAAAGTASSALTATTPNTTSCTGTAPPGFNQYSMFCTKSASPHSNWFADNFDPASPGFGSPARLLFPQQVLKGVDIGLQSGSGGDCEDGASSTTK